MEIGPNTSDDTKHAALGSVEDVPIDKFAANGATVDYVNVAISYGIIERFSEGLYSSPNKAFEELVTNSYDAGASHVWVSLPQNLKDPNESIVVLDNGLSMSLHDLNDLWLIGESRKRSDSTRGREKPVGKFGIGKLATYALAQKLTYIAHRDDYYHAVTMDFGKVSTSSSQLLDSTTLRLQVVSLTEHDALMAIQNAVGDDSERSSQLISSLRHDSASKHWTAAILTNLKPTAGDITRGRLRWVLRTALPLNPDFNLWYGNEKLESSKISGNTIWSYTCGEDEGTLAADTETPWKNGNRTTAKDDSGQEIAAVCLPLCGTVWGKAKLFEQPLDRGKSADQGRSHGVFVRVRRRLINQNSPDLEIGDLRHGTLARLHIEINADDLDDDIAVARESLKESGKLTELKQYIHAIFNRARRAAREHDQKDHMSYVEKDGRLSSPPPVLTQAPLRRMLKHAAEGDESSRAAIGIKKDDIETIRELLNTKEDLVSEVTIDDLGDDQRLVSYAPRKRAAIVNSAHPFVSNYLSAKHSGEILRVVALTEMLTASYMLDEEVPSETIARVIERRDHFLREFSLRNPRSARLIASQLREASTDEKALEDAVGDALHLLGFQVRRMGGAAHGTDGIATARLGRRAEPSSDSYAFTYEVKSSGKSAVDSLKDPSDSESYREKKPKKIRADTARTSVLRVHREKAAQTHGLEIEPNFTLLIAPGFQGESDDGSLINDVCVNDEITPVTVADLARLVEIFPLQGLNPLDLRELLDRRTPQETRQWIEQQTSKTSIPKPPINKIVETLVTYSERRAPTKISSLSMALSMQGYDYSDDEVHGLIRGIHALAPKSVFTDGTVVALNATPDALLRELDSNLAEYDQNLVGAYRDTMKRQGDF